MGQVYPFGSPPAGQVKRRSPPAIRFVTPLSQQRLNLSIKRRNKRFQLGLVQTCAEDDLHVERPLSPCSVDFDKLHPTLDPEVIIITIERLDRRICMRNVFDGEDDASESRAGHTPESVRERELERWRIHQQFLQKYPSTEDSSGESKDEEEDEGISSSKPPKNPSSSPSLLEPLAETSHHSSLETAVFKSPDNNTQRKLDLSPHTMLKRVRP